MSTAQKRDWFVEQKVLNPDKWAKKKYTAVSEQVDEQTDEQSKHDVLDSITEEQFIMEQLSLKKCEDVAGGQKLWSEALADDSYTSEWHKATQQ